RRHGKAKFLDNARAEKINEEVRDLQKKLSPWSRNDLVTNKNALDNANKELENKDSLPSCESEVAALNHKVQLIEERTWDNSTERLALATTKLAEASEAYR
ncbi:hypothetical protein NQ317_014570, partial [Molorchus minor]